MKIFSIDPGSDRIGWSLFNGDHLEGSGVIKVPRIPIEEQAALIRETLRENPFLPFAKRIIIEGQYTGGHAPSHLCTLFTGIIIGALSALHTAPIEFITTTSWHKAVVGMSHPDKKRAKEEIIKIMGIEPSKKTLKSGKKKGSVKESYPCQDELDAIGIGLGWIRKEGKA